MINNIINDFFELNYIIHSIEKNTHQDWSKNLRKIEKKLNDILVHALYKGFTPFTDPFRIEINQMLDHLDQDLKKIKPINAQTDHLVTLVNQVRKKLTSDLSNKKENSPLKIAFLCDLDTPDHNRAILISLKLALDQGVPFITTRSLLKGTGLKDTELYYSETVSLMKLIIEKQKQWEIFQKQNSGAEEEFLVFLPRHLLPEKQGIEKLKALDFSSDLKSITIEEALKEPVKEAHLEEFFSLFSKEPRLNKLFFLSGHGNTSTVGALNRNHYLKFLQFLEYQGCQGLLISSCFSGGQSSLLALSNLPTETKEPNPPFSIIVRSIGDFPTYADEKAEKDLALFFDNWENFIKDQPATLQNLRKLIERIEANRYKSPNNHLKVYFPHATGSPAGFRPVDEQGWGYSLTYNKLKQKELATQKLKNFSFDVLSSKIILTEENYLEIHPLVVKTEISCRKNAPALLSMVPGKSHHLIKSIQLGEIEAETLIKKTINFHKENRFDGAKCFLISQLIAKNEALTEVAIYIQDMHAEYVYKRGSEYFHFSKESGLKKISAYQHTLFVLSSSRKATPTNQAIKTSSGGQESENDYQAALNDRTFHFSSDEILEKPTHRNDQATLLCFFEESHLFEEALTLIQEEGIDPDVKTLNDIPLLSLAVMKKDENMVNYLLSKGVDVNAVSSALDGNSPLHLAASTGDEKIVKTLLNHPQIDLAIQNEKGWTPVTYAVRSAPIFNLFLKNGANLDEVAKDGNTALSTYIRTGTLKEAISLIEAHADPLKGNPSAFITAIRHHKKEIVKMILKRGCSPFQKDQAGMIPAIEAALRGSKEIFKILIDHPNFDPDLTDQRGVNLLIAALFSGDQEKIEVLKNKKCFFPAQFAYQASKMLENALERMNGLNHENNIQEILEWNHHQSKELEWEVGRFLLMHRPLFLQKMIELELIDLRALSKAAFFFEMVDHVAQNPQLLALIDSCLSKKVDLNEVDNGGRSLIEIALSRGNLILTRKLLEAGAQVTSKSLFANILSTSDLDLVKLAVQNGADIRGIEGSFLPLQQAAALPDPEGKIFKWLLAQGADINAVGAEARTPFSEVIWNGNDSLFTYCLEKGADLHPNKKGLFYPIVWAATMRNDPDGKIFKKLLELGEDMNSADACPRASSFSVLAGKGSKDIIEWALKNGAQIEPANPYKKPNPIQTAAARPDDPEGEIVKLLFGFGADLNDPGNAKIAAPFTSIIKKGNLELVKWCWERGANPLLETLTHETPMEAAAKLKNPEILDYLFSKKGRFKTEEIGRELATQALLDGRFEVFDLFVKNKFQISLRTCSSDRLLTCYDKFGSQFFKKLIEHNLDLTYLKGLEEQLLEIAMKHDDETILAILKEKFNFDIKPNLDAILSNVILNESVKLLRAIHPDIQTKIKGKSLLEIAFFNKYATKKKIVRELVDLGMDITEKIGSDKAPAIYYAIESDDLELTELLLQAGPLSQLDEASLSGKTALQLAKQLNRTNLLQLIKNQKI